MNKELYFVFDNVCSDGRLSEMYEINYDSSMVDVDRYLEDAELPKSLKLKTEKYDFLVLPKKYDDDKFYYAQESVEFIKFCKLVDSNCSFDILDDGDIRIRSLHSCDIWLPVIQIANLVLLPIIVGLITNYIYDKLKGKDNEAANVDVTIQINDKNKKKIKTIHYSGDAKTFKDTFDKIDINRLK